MPMRKVTSEERQVFLEHPELVMFYTDTRKKTRNCTFFLASVPTFISILAAVVLIFSPFGINHPHVAVGISVFFMIVTIFGAPFLFEAIDGKRNKKERESYYIDLLRERLPDELFCKVVMVKSVVVEKCEGSCISDGKEELFSYSSYKNVFYPVPDTELAIVTDKKSFWAYIKRDSVTESLYQTTDLQEKRGGVV